MGMKFLNKKGWHTGSLRNIENVWKAEQKRDVEDKKLEELRKQIHEERDRAEFRLLQEQAGLVPKQERLDFLYESGLAVGKASASDGFKALEAIPAKTEAAAPSSSSATAASAAPGALFEEKPQSANDAWRKLHSDPLLMIRQREQEALARVKNNPVQMAMIRKSVEEKMQKKKKHKKKSREEKEHKSKRHRKELSSGSDAEEMRNSNLRKSSYQDDKHTDSAEESYRRLGRGDKKSYQSSKYREHSPRDQHDNNDMLEKETHRSSKQREHPEATREKRDVHRNDRGTVRDKRDVYRNDEMENEKHQSFRQRELSPPGGQSDRETVRDRQDVHRNDREAVRDKRVVHRNDDLENENHRSLKQRDPSPGGRSDRMAVRDKQDVRGNDDRMGKEYHRSSMHRERSPGGRSDQEIERNRRDVKESHRSIRQREQAPRGRSEQETETDRSDIRNNDKSEKNSDLRNSKHGDRSPVSRSDRDVRNDDRSEKIDHRSSKHRERSTGGRSDQETQRDRRDVRNNDKSEKHISDLETEKKEQPNRRRGSGAPKMSEEERLARLREMQMDAEVHEEQRWKRLKRAAEDDAQEASRAATVKGKNFLDVAQRSIFGTDKGGSASIAESVRRRTHYSQGGSENANAFRR